MTTQVLPPVPQTEAPEEVAFWRNRLSTFLGERLDGAVRTTDATPTAILETTLSPVESATYRFSVVARQTGGSGGAIGDTAAWNGYVTFASRVAVATMIGTPDVILQGADNANVTIALAASLDKVQWQVTGDVNCEYDWQITMTALTVGL